MQISRRQTSLGLGALGAASLLPNRAHADIAALEAAARQEGTLTWYVAQMAGDVAEVMGKKFTARYPGVSVTVIRTTGQVAYERLQQELKNKSPQCDVFSSTDIAHYPALKARGALANYVPQNVGELAPAFHGLGEDGYYYPTIASLQVMIYQKEKVKPEDVPRRFTDLLDPKWKGKVATGHPAFSGYFGQFVIAMQKLYGWQYFEKLAKNNPRVGRSAADPITMLNAGECLVGTGAVSVSLQTADKGNPIGFVYPEDGALLCVGPSAVLAAAPHPNAARLFLEWMLSADYAKACAEWYLEPVRADAPPMKGAKRLSDVKLITLTTAEIAKELPGVIEQWRDTIGN
jgi:iron(III) transport system substrate-binding protein